MDMCVCVCVCVRACAGTSGFYYRDGRLHPAAVTNGYAAFVSWGTEDGDKKEFTTSRALYRHSYYRGQNTMTVLKLLVLSDTDSKEILIRNTHTHTHTHTHTNNLNAD